MANLSITRGDTVPIVLTVTNSDGTTRDITGSTVRFTAKHSYLDLDVDAVIALDVTSLTDPEHGIVDLTIPPSATLPLTSYSVLVYDIELTESSGNVTTLVSGNLTVNMDVSIA